LKLGLGNILKVNRCSKPQGTAIYERGNDALMAIQMGDDCLLAKQEAESRHR